jgi:hypothetical protein
MLCTKIFKIKNTVCSFKFNANLQMNVFIFNKQLKQSGMCTRNKW